MGVFDNTFLCLLFHPDAKPPNDEKGIPVERCKDRIDELVSKFEAMHGKIIIPTPALAELLVIAGPNYVKYLDEINGRSCFKVADFDQRAAIEAAIRMADSLADKRTKSGNRQIIKFDRQIVAIAKVEGAKTIYSDDKDVKKYAKECGINTVRIEDLPLPQPTQMNLPGILNVKTQTPDVAPQNSDATPTDGDGTSKGKSGVNSGEEAKK